MFKKYIAIFTFIIMLCPFTVNAASNSYINGNGVSISENDYNFLKQKYTEDRIFNLSKNEIDILLSNDWVDCGSITKYYKTTYGKNANNDVIFENTEEVKKLEYDTSENNKKYYFPTNSIRISCGLNCVSYETTYKKLTLKVEQGGWIAVTKIIVTNEWKQIPSIKKFDIIGFKIIASDYTYIQLNVGGIYSAQQIYDGNVINYEFNTSSDGNTVRYANGVGQVMNIVDSVSSSLSNNMTLYLMNAPTGLVVNASYQHAKTNNITKSEAKSATFGDPGSGYTILGGTFKYTNAIANKYDKMQGVSLTYQNPFVV